MTRAPASLLEALEAHLYHLEGGKGPASITNVQQVFINVLFEYLRIIIGNFKDLKKLIKNKYEIKCLFRVSIFLNLDA